MGFSAALDFSGLEAAFALAEQESGKIIFEKYKEIKGRDSSILLPWMNGTLAEHNIRISDISEWTAGNGPGSFTGLRIAASLVSGIAFGKPAVRTRGMSIAAGIAAAVDLNENKKAAVLFDGRNNELILCKIKRANDDFIPCGESEIHTADSFKSVETTEFDVICALVKDLPVLKNILSEKIFEKISPVPHINISKLIFNDRLNWNQNLADLTYIRPATLAPTIAKAH